MENELLTAVELERVRDFLKRAEGPDDGTGFGHLEVQFLVGLLTRVANQAKLTNEQCNRTIKLLRLLLKEVL